MDLTPYPELAPLLAELFVRLQEGLRPRSHNSCWKIDCFRYPTWHFVLVYRFSGRSQRKSQRLVSLNGEISRQGSHKGEGMELGCSIEQPMIDDINTSDTEKWKYVDDTAIVEPVVKNWASMIQVYVNKLVAKLDANKSQLNDSKCKETRISFAKIDDEFSFSYLAWTFAKIWDELHVTCQKFPARSRQRGTKTSKELKPLTQHASLWA